MPRTLAALGVFAFALAAQSQAQSVSPQTVRPGRYRLEPVHTQILFGVSHMGFTTYFGEFTGASGDLVLEGAKRAASRLDVSVPTADIVTGSDKLTGKLKGEDWLDTATYPAMTFRSTAVSATSPTTADVVGDLTLHGVTRQVTLRAKFNAAGVNPLDSAYTIGFEVRGAIKRSQFGIASGLPRIGDDVDLIISAAFERTPGP